MSFFKFIYYSVGILFVLYSIGWIANPYEKSLKSLAFQANLKKYKDLKWDDYPEEHKSELKGKIYILILFSWMVLGIFTFQWLLFASFLFIEFTVIQMIGRLLKGSNFMYAIFNWINSIIGACFGIFTILNAYHLHIDVNSVIIDLIKQLFNL